MSGMKKFPFQQVEVDEKKVIGDIGRNMHHARKKKGISVRMLALQAGVQERYLYKIEKGKHQAGIMTIIRVTKALDMNIDDLVNGTFDDEE